jgi:Ca2+-transporting ATPase
VPDDAVLLQSHDLQTDESLLTGESVPVRKITSGSAAPSKDRRSGGDDLPYVFSGSMVVRGTGIGEVIAMGALSEIGKIGQSLSTLETEPPRLQAQTRRLVRGFATAGGGERPGGAALRYFTRRMARCGARWHRARHVDAPRRVPGRAHRIHGDGCLANLAGARADRRAAAIETRGSATVLCTDKPGTLKSGNPSGTRTRVTCLPTRAVSPASRFLPASRKSFDQR